MPLRNWISLLLTHPTDVKLLVQFWIHHRRNQRDITDISQWEHTGYERLAMRRCWELLDQTGPTLASVIKQLEGPLARTVSS
jgi:farnesyl-diphosphate farnesyltransferase